MVGSNPPEGGNILWKEAGRKFKNELTIAGDESDELSRQFWHPVITGLDQISFGMSCFANGLECDMLTFAFLSALSVVRDIDRGLNLASASFAGIKTSCINAMNIISPTCKLIVTSQCPPLAYLR